MAEAFRASYEGVASNTLQSTLLDVGEVDVPLVTTASPASNALSATSGIALAELSSTRDAITAAAALHAVDPLDTALQAARQTSDTLLVHLEAASARFFDLLRRSVQDDCDSRSTLTAFHEVRTTIDDILISLSQAGLGSLPCPTIISATGNDLISPANSAIQQQKGIFSFEDIGAEATSTFEKRERLRESAAMVSNILMHNV